MANANTPNGFHVLNSQRYTPMRWPVEASFAGKDGSAVFLNSAGRATQTASGIALGIQLGLPYDSLTNQTIDTAGNVGADDFADVYTDPAVEFWGQISTGLLTDPYTTRSSAAAYDIAGSGGVEYIDAAASTNDNVQIIGRHYESNGELSAYSTYQKVKARFNPAKHAFGTIA